MQNYRLAWQSAIIEILIILQLCNSALSASNHDRSFSVDYHLIFLFQVKESLRLKKQAVRSVSIIEEEDEPSTPQTP